MCFAGHVAQTVTHAKLTTCTHAKACLLPASALSRSPTGTTRAGPGWHFKQSFGPSGYGYIALQLLQQSLRHSNSLNHYRLQVLAMMMHDYRNHRDACLPELQSIVHTTMDNTGNF